MHFLRIDRAHYTAGNGLTLPKGPSNLHSHFWTIHNTIMCRVTLAENHYFITPDCSWQVHCLYVIRHWGTRQHWSGGNQRLRKIWQFGSFLLLCVGTWLGMTQTLRTGELQCLDFLGLLALDFLYGCLTGTSVFSLSDCYFV